MFAANFNLPDYYQRIGFNGDFSPDLASLTRLMQAQLFSVPFENLDVQAGKIVSLDPEHIVDKIVHQGRGGYCYEVNGLFAMALTALAIPYQLIAARPMFYPSRRPKTHMVLRVQLAEQDYLCDLGFGSYGIREPLAFSPLNQPVRQGFDQFRLINTPQDPYVMQALVNGEWASQYGFDLSPQEWIDFMPANYLNSTHPEAIFVRHLLVLMHTPTGRKVLFADHFKEFHHGQLSQQRITANDYNRLLKEHFALPAYRSKT